MISRQSIFRTLVLNAVFLLAVSHYAHAQKADTLKEIKVHGWRKRTVNDEKLNIYAPGQKIKAIDSITLRQYQLQSVSNLLAQQTPVFIKSYGFNSLSTLSFRGASAAQSQVLWNGIPIQNAALGIADVATLPVLLMNKVNIVYGGSSALLGSGNVGGALVLENDAPIFDSNKKTTLSVLGGAGSFGQYMGGIKSSFSTQKWFFALNAFAQTAQNNFTYTNDSAQKKQTTNDHLSSGAITAQAAYKIDEQNTIGIIAWYQQYYRQIPAALFETNSQKKQNDGSLRLLLNWDKHTATTQWYIKSSFIQDEVDYSDVSIPLIANNTSYQSYTEAGWDHILSTHSRLLFFIPLQFSWLHVDDSIGTKQQIKIALAGAYRINFFQDRLKAALNARAESIDGKLVFLPGADASYSLFSWLQLRANVQRTYRAPTLNELYYNPGGNPNLKPEQGWNEDAGYELKTKLLPNLSFYHDLSVFDRQINDWIIWLGGAIWTPHNIATVYSRGVETENRLEWNAGPLKLHLGLNTSYVIATTVSSYIAGDGSIGKQIPYTPRYTGQANIGFSWWHLYLNYSHTYTGYRFITTDESEYISPYQTGNVSMLYDFYISKKLLQLSAQVNNIWNEQYQVVAFRPMPGINWLIGLRFNIM